MPVICSFVFFDVKTLSALEKIEISTSPKIYPLQSTCLESVTTARKTRNDFYNVPKYKSISLYFSKKTEMCSSGSSERNSVTCMGNELNNMSVKSLFESFLKCNWLKDFIIEFASPTTPPTLCPLSLLGDCRESRKGNDRKTLFEHCPQFAARCNHSSEKIFGTG